jgi:dsRNA-specific ribonuclease
MENIPPLPKFSGELMLEVFTHKSLRPDLSGEPTNDEYGGNDRLAELGAKVLEMAITFCLFSKRPMLKAADIEVRSAIQISTKI